MSNSRDIPAAVQRQVRQECHFGCVICGMPVFEYDHIENFAYGGTHEPANLALLCPNHHRDKTSGRLSRERVAEARKKPFNAGQGQTAAYGIQASANLEVWFGSNYASDPGRSPERHVVLINGHPFLTIHREGDAFTYSTNVTDEHGQLLISIDHGVLTVATHIWDYRYEGRTVSIRSQAGEILFEAEITDELVRIRRGTFVDRFETGLLVKPDGGAVITMSGLHIGEVREGRFGSGGDGALAIIRGSCVPGPPNGSFGFLRYWPAEFEQFFEGMRCRLETDARANYPAGLENFRPYPRTR